MLRCRDPRTGLLVSSKKKSLNALEEEPGAGKSDGEDKTEAAAARQGCSHERQGGRDHNGGYDDNWWYYDTQWALDAIGKGKGKGKDGKGGKGGQGGRGGGGGGKGFSGKCHWCHRLGHRQAECREETEWLKARGLGREAPDYQPGNGEGDGIPPANPRHQEVQGAAGSREYNRHTTCLQQQG